jgi:hypothetical protein
LQLFNGGLSLEKRYLFGVVQQMLMQNVSTFQYGNQESDDIDNDDGDGFAIDIDNLSQLFGSISNICCIQFELLSKV